MYCSGDNAIDRRVRRVVCCAGSFHRNCRGYRGNTRSGRREERNSRTRNLRTRNVAAHCAVLDVL
jgi:hypothetical protein